MQCRQVVLQNFPFLDTKIQTLINEASQYYGVVKDSPFEDENIRLLFDILGIKPQPRHKILRFDAEEVSRTRQEARAQEANVQINNEHLNEGQNQEPEQPQAEANLQNQAPNVAAPAPPRNNIGINDVNRAVFK